MSTISIIVPVYNIEKYLRRCIDSILAQTYKDFELLLIDDGSKDNSSAICDEYQILDKRIKVLHQENKGLSGARNAALEIAKGRYITFVDGDDWIEKDLLEHLYNLLTSYNADMSCCSFSLVSSEDEKPKSKGVIYTNELTPKEAIIGFLKGEVGCEAWGKLYKKEIFESIRFPQGLTTEDLYIFADTILASEKIVYSSEQKYNYYYNRSESITNNVKEITIYDSLKASRKTYDQLMAIYPDIKELVTWGYYGKLLYNIISTMRSQDNLQPVVDIMLKEIQGIRSALKNYKEINLKHRIILNVFDISPKLYYQSIRILYRLNIVKK